jgi:K+-sensing histidine kinase KdpD
VVDFFLTKPYESFTMNRSADQETTALLIVVAVAVGEIAARSRHHHTETVLRLSSFLNHKGGVGKDHDALEWSIHAPHDGGDPAAVRGRYLSRWVRSRLGGRTG